MQHSLIHPTSGQEYVGCVPLGQLAGTGTFRGKDGSVYEGKYEAKRMHGAGVFEQADGVVYRGQYRVGQKEGHGVTTYPSGNVHRGQYKGGQREGYCVYTYAKGKETYRGQFKGNVGKREGYGVITTYPSGNVYRGQWKKDKKEGHGVDTSNGEQTFGWYEGGKKVSSVPFDAANPEHAAVLRAANEAEARCCCVDAPHRLQAPSAHFVQALANAAEPAANAAAVRIVLHTRTEDGLYAYAPLGRRRAGKRGRGAQRLGGRRGQGQGPFSCASRYYVAP
jgi:hypothetical protein